MRILSVNFSHDGCGLILDEGRQTAYVATERFSRCKKQPGLREEDLDNLLDQAGLTVRDLDLVLLVNVGMRAPEVEARHRRSFDEDFFAHEVNAAGDRVRLRGHELPCVVNPDHFLCHAAAAFYCSPFESALCFACDAIASGAYVGLGRTMRRLDVLDTRVGDLYTQISIEIGFGGVFGAGKTMGLAPYGAHDDPEVLDRLAERATLGTSGVNLQRQVEELLGASAQKEIPFVDGPHRWNAALAFHAQRLLELELLAYLDGLRLDAASLCPELPDVTRPNLCLGGGTALNSVANQLVFQSGRFRDLYLHPACGDDGTALGAALYQYHHVAGRPRRPWSNHEVMYSSRTYPIDDALFAPYRDRLTVERRADDLQETARLLAAGEIVGFFQGPSEIGPRALGNRSILADPRGAGTRDRLNARVKLREAFRPFAPAVLDRHARDWFGLDESPFMLRVAPVLRPGVPAITHVDGTARVQTVSHADNPRLYDLIEEFALRTDVPMVLNTSFNIGGEPIVETPVDALESFLRSTLDCLVFPQHLVRRSVSP